LLSSAWDSFDIAFEGTKVRGRDDALETKADDRIGSHVSKRSNVDIAETFEIRLE
jgi:hypothetical protein